MEKEKITSLMDLDLELSRIEGFLAILYNLFEKNSTEMDMAVGSEARDGYIWLVDTMKKIVGRVDIKQIKNDIIMNYELAKDAEQYGKSEEQQKAQKAEGHGQAKGKPKA